MYCPDQFAPGSIIHGSYEIIRLLGIGGSGVVYLCRNRKLDDHLVAMKVFSSRSSYKEVDTKRFKQEILAAYQVNHPNVVRCYEYLVEENFMAYTMEYLPQGNLADKISQGIPLGYDQIVSILSTICSGLQAVHDAGIVHRDLKPENVLLTSEGNIKITDFSIALMLQGARLNTDGLLGTVEYISPEYMNEGTIDHRSDLFSLGVIAYEMIAGQLPFQGKNLIQTLCMRASQEAQPLQSIRDDCPIFLEKIVKRALAANPEDRYQSAQEMGRDLTLLHEVMKRNNFLEIYRESEKESETKTPLTKRGRKAKERIKSSDYGRYHSGPTVQLHEISLEEKCLRVGILCTLSIFTVWLLWSAIALV